MCSTLTTRPKIKTATPSHNPLYKNSPLHHHLINCIKIKHNLPKQSKWVRHRVRSNPYISTQNKFSDNLKSPIFTQNYLSSIWISLANSTYDRSPFEVIPLHDKYKLHTILNNSLHLNHVISQIPLSYLPKTQQSLPIKMYHNSLTSTKIITRNTHLEVHIFNIPKNIYLNCVKFLHNSNL